MKIWTMDNIQWEGLNLLLTNQKIKFFNNRVTGQLAIHLLSIQSAAWLLVRWPLRSG